MFKHRKFPVVPNASILKWFFFQKISLFVLLQIECFIFVALLITIGWVTKYVPVRYYGERGSKTMKNVR